MDDNCFDVDLGGEHHIQVGGVSADEASFHGEVDGWTSGVDGGLGADGQGNKGQQQE